MQLIRSGWEKRISSSVFHTPETCWYIEVEAGCIDFGGFDRLASVAYKSWSSVIMFFFACYRWQFAWCFAWRVLYLLSYQIKIYLSNIKRINKKLE